MQSSRAIANFKVEAVLPCDQQMGWRGGETPLAILFFSSRNIVTELARVLSDTDLELKIPVKPPLPREWESRPSASIQNGPTESLGTSQMHPDELRAGQTVENSASGPRTSSAFTSFCITPPANSNTMQTNSQWHAGQCLWWSWGGADPTAVRARWVGVGVN